MKSERRPFLAARGMSVDVDQAWRDNLAARIDHRRGLASDVRLDRGDPACGNRHVAHRVERHRWVDDAPTPDDQIIARRARLWNAGADCSTRGCRHKMTPCNHRRSPSLVMWKK